MLYEVITNTSDTIGYRGVGFKSSTSISNDIIIFSNSTYFTFSKKLCAKKLNVDSEKVPTIRIPFLLSEDEIDGESYNFV